MFRMLPANLIVRTRFVIESDSLYKAPERSRSENPSEPWEFGVQRQRWLLTRIVDGGRSGTFYLT